MVVFCFGILYTTAPIPEEFWPVFYSRRKGQMMCFFQCLVHRFTPTRHKAK